MLEQHNMADNMRNSTLLCLCTDIISEKRLPTTAESTRGRSSTPHGGRSQPGKRTTNFGSLFESPPATFARCLSHLCSGDPTASAFQMDVIAVILRAPQVLFERMVRDSQVMKITVSAGTA